MHFVLFILVNAVLFIRPMELVPGMEDFPLYEILIAACTLVTLPLILGQLNLRNLRERPIAACAILLPAAVVLSLLTHGLFGYSLEKAFEFSKVLLYFWLFIDSPQRLNRYLMSLVVFVTFLTGLALSQYFELIDIPSLSRLEQVEHDEETGEISYTPRLRSTGIYHDPNDLSLILLVAILISLYRLNCKESGLARLGWLLPLVLFGVALALTKSRGGFLGLMASLFILFRARYGWWRTIALSGLVFPALLLLFAGRQTDLSAATSGTGQDRIQLWSEGLSYFRQAPVFGIGYGNYDDEVGHVAHNSFLHCFTEMGLFGGMLFLGTFLGAFLTLYRAGTISARLVDPEVLRLRAYLMAVVAAYTCGLMTLSRAYVAPTYMVLGLACVYSHFQRGRLAIPVLRFDWPFFRRLSGVSIVFLIGMYLFVRTFVRWS
jgi:O-antigen ligase